MIDGAPPAPAPVFRVGAHWQPEVARDLLRLEIDDDTDGPRPLTAPRRGAWAGGDVEKVDGHLRSGGLEVALQGAGVAAHEEICLRRIDVRLRTPARGCSTEVEWAERFNQAFTAAIRSALDSGGDQRIVRYPHRQAALCDMAAAVLGGDTRRAWAWRQLGLWRGDLDGRGQAGALAELRAALLAAPSAIVSALAGLAIAAAGGPALLLRLPDEDWPSLARAALGASEIAPAVLTPSWLRASLRVVGGADRAGGVSGRAQPAGNRTGAAAVSVDASPRQASWADWVVARSAIAGAVIAGANRLATRVGGVGRENSQVRRAVAALAILEVDPNALRSPGGSGLTEARGAPLVDEVALALALDVTSTVAVRRAPGPPGRVPTPGRPGRRGETAYAGLLFLLPILEEIALPARLAERSQRSPAATRRPLRFFLGRLALALTGAAADDPASLALAGLPPGADLELPGEPLCTGDEQSLIAALAEEIADAAGCRLSQERDPLPPAQALALICQRPAEIRGDHPGWIDVWLGAGELPPALRRAGLCLAPGFVPWLGVHVRFLGGDRRGHQAIPPPAVTR
jgi:hypothetical protein